MKSSDITLTVLIIIIFIILYLFNILSIGIKKIEEDWPTYRCNPIVMPFASVFGQDTAANFTYCIQTMQSNYMNYLLEPLHYNFSVIGELGETIRNAINSARAFINNLRNFVASIIQNVFGVFLNILLEFQKVTMALKDMVGKMVGVLATLMYTIEASMYAGQSTWNGAPGKAVRALAGFCFHPDTLVKTQDGKEYKMCNLPLNATLKNGVIVQSVMRLSNVKDNGQQREKMYRVKYGENGEDIIVSGSHLIWDGFENQFVPVEVYADRCKEIGQFDLCQETDIICPELSCLITSNHTIPIGQWIFHDWEDNNGSPAKSLER